MKTLTLSSIVVLVSVIFIGFTPVIQYDDTGSVSGVVNPPEAMATVEAVLNGEVVATTETEPETGIFVLEELPAGNYELVIIPASEEYETKKINDLTIKAGEHKDLGEIYL